MPADVLLPHIVYQDVENAIAWLRTVFGFVEHYRYGAPGEPAGGAQMHLGDAGIMLRRARPGSGSPAQLGYETQSLTVFVDDVQAHYRRTKAAGAKIVEEPHETECGEFQYGAGDFDGHHWLFSEHARDVSPEAGGANLAR